MFEVSHVTASAAQMRTTSHSWVACVGYNRSSPSRYTWSCSHVMKLPIVHSQKHLPCTDESVYLTHCFSKLNSVCAQSPGGILNSQKLHRRPELMRLWHIAADRWHSWKRWSQSCERSWIHFEAIQLTLETLFEGICDRCRGSETLVEHMQLFIARQIPSYVMRVLPKL